MPLLECKQLTKCYGKGHQPALNNVDLCVESGQIIGLLGPNGSGKTTFIKLIAGLITPTGGELFVGGNAPGRDTKAMVAYLPDASCLMPWMKVLQLVDFFETFFADFDRVRAIKIMYSLDIDLNQVYKKLSKGMQDKVQLALTMARRAKLYVLDEPIGGVDPAARDYIMRAILGNTPEDATVIVATHLIADIEEVLDEVIILRKGEIILHDKADTLRAEHDKSVDAIFREVFAC